MFCSKCGAQLGENTVCSACGFDLDNVSDVDVDTVKEDPVNPAPKTEEVLMDTNAGKQAQGILCAKNILSVKAVIFSILGLVVLFLFFSAASKIAASALNIMDIQSVGGKTLDEAYYLELGGIYAAYAMMSRGFGLFFASTLIWLGFKK